MQKRSAVVLSVAGGYDVWFWERLCFFVRGFGFFCLRAAERELLDG